MALAMVALIGILGLVVDVGLMTSDRRRLQNAADAAALAGGQELLGSAGTARTVAENWARKNGLNPANEGYSFTATIPHQGKTTRMEVRVAERRNYTFGRVVGLTPAVIQARAVAGGDIVSLPALFANDTSCGNRDAIQISGSTNTVTGDVHSNAWLKVNGSNNDVNGVGAYVCNNQVSGSGNDFTSGPSSTSVRPLPLDYSYSDFPCTRSFNGNFNFNSHNNVWLNNDPSTNTLKPGTYCATGKIELSGSNVTGNVTLVARDTVNISGSDVTLTPFAKQVLIFTEVNSPQAADLSGSHANWSGIILAENGTAKLAGSSNSSFRGSVIAHTIQVSGSNQSVTSFDDGGKMRVKLLE